jgi:hypothetical protein
MNRLEFAKRSCRIAPILLSIVLIGCAPTPVEQPSEPIAVVRDIDISGVWLLDVESPMGREEIVARFEQAGTELSGVMNAKGVDVPLRGDLDGDAVQFDMTFDVRGKPLTLQYNGTVRGEAMSGTVQFGPMGTGRFSGHRAP